MVNARSVYTDSFRWRKSEGTKLLVQLIMGDFQVDKEVKPCTYNFVLDSSLFLVFVTIFSDPDTS